MVTRRTRPDLIEVGDTVEWAGDDMLCTTGRVVAVLLPIGDVAVQWDLGSGWAYLTPPGTWSPVFACEFDDLIIYTGRPFTEIQARKTTPA